MVTVAGTSSRQILHVRVGYVHWASAPAVSLWSWFGPSISAQIRRCLILYGRSYWEKERRDSCNVKLVLGGMIGMQSLHRDRYKAAHTMSPAFDS